MRTCVSIHVSVGAPSLHQHRTNLCTERPKAQAGEAGLAQGLSDLTRSIARSIIIQAIPYVCANVVEAVHFGFTRAGQSRNDVVLGLTGQSMVFAFFFVCSLLLVPCSFHLLGQILPGRDRPTGHSGTCRC